MGITDWKLVTEEGQKNWAAAVESEIAARYHWNENWGWTPKLIAHTTECLKNLKQQRSKRVSKKSETPGVDVLISVLPPLPDTTNHEYGWLATSTEFQIEIFGPFPGTKRVKVPPTPEEVYAEAMRLRELRKSKTKVDYTGLESVAPSVTSGSDPGYSSNKSEEI